ncbi:MAG: hypothetical protein CMJ31_09085, partial [Phycisphaerae bacterium]|nr:hypothetical protein [Phycisphaerae bacterium]
MVISGMGVVSGFGLGAAAFWDGLVEGRSTIGQIGAFDASAFPSVFGAEVPDLDVKKLVPKPYRKATKVMARDSELAVAAAQCAVFDAGLSTRGSGATTDLSTAEDAPPIDGARTGCQIGAGLIAADTRELTAALSTSRDEDGAFSLKRWGSAEGGEGGMNNLPPLWMLKYLPNMLACHVTIIHGLEGPSNTITCAEASGVLSAGESLRAMQRGDADLCFSGGVESKINPMGITRLTLAERLARTEGVAPEEAWKLVRPFDPAGAGSLIGEGGAIFVLEPAEKAAARGRDAWAVVAGFGAAQSTDHPLPGIPFDVRPDRVDPGVSLAAARALRDAGVSADEIDVIVPSGYGVPAVDVGEFNALRAVMGDRLAEIPMLTLAPSIGLCAAGHGALQIAAAAACLREQRLPSRL